jgi:hypothetical protein
MTARWLPFLLIVTACSGGTRYIVGTNIKDSNANRQIVMAVEKYREAMERKDAPALLSMASKNYWEDGGTPTGSDDYSYDGLREVLAQRFQKAESIRLSLRYMKLRQEGARAFVEVLVDASYSIQTAHGSERMDKKDQNELVLENEGGRWLFVSGM